MLADHRMSSAITPDRGHDAKGKHSPWTNPRLRKMHKSSPPWKLPDVAEERAGEDGDGRTGASRSPAAQDLKLRFTDENCPPSPALSCMEQDDQPAARPVPWQLSCDVTPNDAGPLPAGHLDCDEAAASLQLRSAEPDSTVLNSTSDGQGDTSGPAIGPPSPLTGPVGRRGPAASAGVSAPCSPAIQPPAAPLQPQLDQLGSPQGLPGTRQPRRRRLSVLRRRAPLQPEDLLPGASSAAAAAAAPHSHSCEFPSSLPSMEVDAAMGSMYSGLGQLPLHHTAVSCQLSWPPAALSQYPSLHVQQAAAQRASAESSAFLAAHAKPAPGAGETAAPPGDAKLLLPVTTGLTLLSRKPKAAATTAAPMQPAAESAWLLGTALTPQAAVEDFASGTACGSGQLEGEAGTARRDPVVGSPRSLDSDVTGGKHCMGAFRCNDSSSSDSESDGEVQSTAKPRHSVRSRPAPSVGGSPEGDAVEIFRSVLAGSGHRLHVDGDSDDDEQAISKSVLDRALWQAEQDGDAEAVQRIWAKMQAGASRADVDSLNLLLKSFCRVGGNPGEAEALVKEACQGGKIMPNAATYHQLAGMWLRHEQLHCE